MLSRFIDSKIRVDLSRKGRTFNKIFCSYESLFDLDSGCIGYILSNYSDSKFIDKAALKYTPFFLQYKLVHRENPNPLSIIFKNEYQDQIDNLYLDLLQTRIDDISKLAFPTYLIALIKELKSISGYIIEVECNSKVRKDRVSKLNLTCIDTQKSLDDYFSLVLRSPSELKDRGNISGKTIYFWNTTINYYQMKKGVENELLVDEIIALMGMKNIIKLIDPYQFTEELED